MLKDWIKILRLALRREGLRDGWKWLRNVANSYISFLRRLTFRHSDTKFVSPLSTGIYPTYAHNMCSCISEAHFVYVF